MNFWSRSLRKLETLYIKTRKYVKKDFDGFSMILNLRDGGISKALYKRGGRELAFISLLNRTVSKGMICLDVGANIGYVTLQMLRNVGESGFVYAIEPDPRNIELLSKNVENNGFSSRCEIVNGVLTDCNGDVDFWLARKPNVNSLYKNAKCVKRIKVKSYDLVSFLKDRKFPNFIKMDVEGAEVDILNKGIDYFAENTGEVSILVEAHQYVYNKYNKIEKFVSILNEYFKLGFYPKYVITTPVPQPELFLKAGYSPIESINTDGCYRGIYDNISAEDFVKFVCNQYPDSKGNLSRCVRAFMIQRS